MCFAPSIPWNGESGWSETQRTSGLSSFSLRAVPTNVPLVHAERRRPVDLRGGMEMSAWERVHVDWCGLLFAHASSCRAPIEVVPPGGGPHAFSACPPKAKRMAERIRSA